MPRLSNKYRTPTAHQSLRSPSNLRPILAIHAPPTPSINAPHPFRTGQLRSLHHTLPLYSSFLSRWLSRGSGMRRTIGTWADSLGITGHVNQGSGSREIKGISGDMKEGEELFVMPGWAVVKYRNEQGRVEDGSPAPFDIRVSVSGFCSEARSPSKVSRTQRVIISVVRRFAALPNLPGMNPDNQPMGPIPTAVGMAFMEQAEEESDEEKEAERRRRQHSRTQQPPQESSTSAQVPYKPYVSRRRNTPAISPITPLDSSSTQSQPSGTGILPSRPASVRTMSRQSSISSSLDAFTGNDEIRSAHLNLNARLAPFWSSVLPSRRVLFDIYATPPTNRDPGDDDETADKAAPPEQPLHSFEFYTDGNGHFSQVVVIPWEKLCTTPSTVGAVFDANRQEGVPLQDWNLRLRSRLDYEVLPVEESEMSYKDRIRRALSSYGVDAVDPVTTPADPAQHADASSASAREVQPRDSKIPALEKLSLNTPGEPQVIEWTTIRVGRAGGVHLISDLDDTVKHSDILAGPREVFRNVFCRPLEEICVPEMDAMYRRLDDRGVAGFHFVSNSPSQLFPSIRRFLTVNSFPPRHSIKLKYYGGRSIFSSLYDSPAERKRSSLTELFLAFPKATFIMFGDSAEQDLELYMEFGLKFPGRVAMVAIRDVTSDRAAEVWREVDKLDQGSSTLSSTTPTDAGTPMTDEPVNIASPISRTRTTPHIPGEMPARTPLLRTASSASAISEEELRSLSSTQQKILQRALTWQNRQDKAKKEKPDGMVLRFYKDPAEVEGEVTEIIDRLK